MGRGGFLFVRPFHPSIRSPKLGEMLFCPLHPIPTAPKTSEQKLRQKKQPKSPPLAWTPPPSAAAKACGAGPRQAPPPEQRLLPPALHRDPKKRTGTKDVRGGLRVDKGVEVSCVFFRRLLLLLGNFCCSCWGSWLQHRLEASMLPPPPHTSNASNFHQILVQIHGSNSGTVAHLPLYQHLGFDWLSRNPLTSRLSSLGCVLLPVQWKPASCKKFFGPNIPWQNATKFSSASCL